MRVPWLISTSIDGSGRCLPRLVAGRRSRRSLPTDPRRRRHRPRDIPRPFAVAPLRHGGRQRRRDNQGGQFCVLPRGQFTCRRTVCGGTRVGCRMCCGPRGPIPACAREIRSGCAGTVRLAFARSVLRCAPPACARAASACQQSRRREGHAVDGARRNGGLRHARVRHACGLDDITVSRRFVRHVVDDHVVVRCRRLNVPKLRICVG